MLVNDKTKPKFFLRRTTTAKSHTISSKIPGEMKFAREYKHVNSAEPGSAESLAVYSVLLFCQRAGRSLKELMKGNLQRR